MNNRTRFGNTPIDESQKESIRQRVKALNIESQIASKDVMYTVYGPHNFPVRGCNEAAVAQWQAYIATNASEKVIIGDMKKRFDEHRQTNWVQHAINATHRMIRAFELAQVPLILAAGAHLGWYRQCSVMEHTNDIDFYSPSEYIVSRDHFRLLTV